MYYLIKIAGVEPKTIVKLLTNENFEINFVNSVKSKFELADIIRLTSSRYSKGTVNLFCQRN